MAYAKFAGYEIPKVYEVNETRLYVGETVRTAGGNLRRDTITVKRRWEIKCRPVPKSQLEPLLNHLENTLCAEDEFWLYEFGPETNTVLAMVDPESIELNTVGVVDENGVWHKDGKQLSLAIEEV
jgi:hypothetical protein